MAGEPGNHPASPGCLITVRILGYVMARDEWPLLGLAITVALGHVDHVLVLDHRSRDATTFGLERMQRDWPGRLTVYHLGTPSFAQEAATRVMAAAADFASYDWVYVFDADEFLITSRNLRLKDVLAGVPRGIDLVRYEVHNWIVSESFDDADLSRYPEIRQRARPSVFLEVDGAVLADGIEHGDLNFFDVPFGSKAIVRGHLAGGLAAGAHDLSDTGDAADTCLPPERLRAGHLPFTSRRRLQQKCRHGQRLIDAGLSRSHGWQNQMLSRIESAGGLEAFWAEHSLPNDADPSAARPGLALPVFEQDDALAETLSPAVELFVRSGCFPVSDRPELPARSSDVSLDKAMYAVRDTQRTSDRVKAERDRVKAERDRVKAERDRVKAERDRVKVERDEAQVRLEAARRERDTVTAQRDAALAHLSAITTSRIWRWTAWYRSLRAAMRVRLGR